MPSISAPIGEQQIQQLVVYPQGVRHGVELLQQGTGARRIGVVQVLEQSGEAATCSGRTPFKSTRLRPTLASIRRLPRDFWNCPSFRRTFNPTLPIGVEPGGDPGAQWKSIATPPTGNEEASVRDIMRVGGISHRKPGENASKRQRSRILNPRSRRSPTCDGAPNAIGR